MDNYHAANFINANVFIKSGLSLKSCYAKELFYLCGVWKKFWIK